MSRPLTESSDTGCCYQRIEPYAQRAPLPSLPEATAGETG